MSIEKESVNDSEVVIAGTGIAAAACALRLLSVGFFPWLISVRRATAPGVEAIPEGAFPLISELNLDDAVAYASGKIVEGFENAWRPDLPVLRPGRWLHVERSAFASAAIRRALALGARISNKKELGAIPKGCLAAVDATGRFAAWSRPIRRQGRQVADLFELPTIAERGRIERLPDGWMYRIGSTLGVVGPHDRCRFATPADARYLGRRPAFPQWCEKPIQGRRIAVGDAALAYDPLAGQGIRFALASAFAAASVIQTWREDGDLEPATRFYTNFVAQARIRHLNFLEKLTLDISFEDPQSVPARVQFSGRLVNTQLSIESRIVTDQAVLLADHTAVRWLSGVDLLELEKLARRSMDSASLLGFLISEGLNTAQAEGVLAWCLRQGVLKASS